MADKPVSEWDLEELRRGQRRNARGSFTGRPPTTAVVERQVHEELWRRIMDDAARKLRDGVPEALDGVMALARDEEMPPQVRLSAYTYWIDRVYGKAVQPMVHAVAAMKGTEPRAPWEQAIEEMVSTIEPQQFAADEKLRRAYNADESPDATIARQAQEIEQLRAELGDRTPTYEGTSRVHDNEDDEEDARLMEDLVARS